MLVPGLLQLAGQLELLQRERADRLDQAQARRPAERSDGGGGGVLDEAAERVGGAGGVELGAREQPLRFGDAERPTEHGQATQDVLLDRRQQPVAPVDRGLDRPLASGPVRIAGGEEDQAAVAAHHRVDLDGHSGQPPGRDMSCGELDRERKAAQRPADARGIGQRVGARRRVRRQRSGALEQ